MNLSSMTDTIRRLSTTDAGFAQALDGLLAYESAVNTNIKDTVQSILMEVKAHGDEALVRLTNKLDQRSVTRIEELVIGADELQAALNGIDSKLRSALEYAADRIKTYHEKQVQVSWQYQDAAGAVLGQKITPMDRVGLYAPGGKAAYPSSVLMTAIPAKVAGVKELVLVTPAPGGSVNKTVMAAAAIAGIDRVISIGGAQAVAALAYGTSSIKKVDKIVGPGNAYVAEAKRAVFGLVDIDMIAGPSEILIYADAASDPDWVAMDLFSQAEHGEDSQSILISTSADFLEKVSAAIERSLPSLSREAIARVSLKERGALILAENEQVALDLINRIAPEHLELSIDDPERLVPEIRHAGAIFMGRHTSESLGDYCAGPNHVLPTSGTARFSSPLGVYDFQKRTSIIQCSPESASELGKIASVLARSEGLEAHALSAEYRIKK